MVRLSPIPFAARGVPAWVWLGLCALLLPFTGSQVLADDRPMSHEVESVVGPGTLSEGAPGYCPPLRFLDQCCRDSIAFVGSFRVSRDFLQFRIRFGGQSCPSTRSGPHYVVAWIDWNSNRNWEESERVYFAAPFFGTFTCCNSPRECEGDTVMTPIIRIPASVTVDTTWMRVGVFYHEDYIAPCTDLPYYGNTVDHRVILRNAAVVQVDAEGAETPIQEVQDPVWHAALAFGTCDPIVDRALPFAGGFRGPGPTLRVHLEACSGPTDFTPRVTYRWKVIDRHAAAPDTGSGTFEGWQGRIKLRLPRHVQKTQTVLAFDIEDGNGNVLRSDQTITLDTYVGYDRAANLSEAGSGAVKLAWIDRATAWGDGGASPLDIASRLNTNVFENGAEFYRDGAVAWFDLSSVGGSSQVGNCTSVSALWAAMARVLGVSGAATIQTRGAYGAGFVTQPGSSISFDPGQVGNCGPEFASTPDRWDFLMHQVGILPITGSPRFFDPTYGREYASFPSELVLWDLFEPFLSSGIPTQLTDEGHTLYLHRPPSTQYPWGFWYFTPTSSSPDAEQAHAGSNGIEALAVELVGPGTWTSDDPNSDGEAEALRWDGTVAIVGMPGESASYTLTGQLFSGSTLIAWLPADGAMLATVSHLVDVGPGTYPVSLRFSGEEIRLANVDGPYDARLWLTDSAGIVVDSLHTPTSPVAASSFGERPIRMGSPSDRGLDRDGSGFLDDIEVDIPLLVKDTASVRVSAYATVPIDSVHFGAVDTSFVALPGSVVVRLALPGTEFVLHGVDGPYSIHVEAEAEGARAEEADFTSQAYMVSDFDGPAVSRLGPAGAASAADRDGDGQADELSWVLAVDCLRAGVYQTRAVLAAADGTPIVSAVGEDTLAVGFADIRLTFPGSPIADAQLDPARIISLETLTEDGVLTMSGDDFETNVTVSHTLFRPSAPFVRWESTFSSNVADTNGDGRHDRLTLQAQVTNLRDSTARITADAWLFGPVGEFITVGRGEAVAGPGTTVPLTVRFDGKAIHVARVDGPYAVDQLYAVSDLDSLRLFGSGAYLAHAHTTAAHSAFQFAPAPHAFGLVVSGGPVAGAEVSMGKVPALSDTGGRYRLGTPDLQPGTYTISLALPAGFDTTDWRVLRNGEEYALGRSASITFDSTEAVRIDFVRGAAVAVEGGTPGRLLRVVGFGPNPRLAQAETRLQLELAAHAYVSVSLFDVSGRLVSRPHDGWLPAGLHSLTWSASSQHSLRLVPGMYLLAVKAKDIQGRRMEWKGRLAVLR